MTKTTYLCEAMICAYKNGHRVRVWRELAKYNSAVDISNEEIKKRAIDMMKQLYHGPGGLQKVDLMRRLVDLPGVSSVEIIEERTGDGFCVHKDWP